MNNPDGASSWLDFSDQLAVVAARLLADVPIPNTEKDAGNPKVIATTLLIRTLSNFEAAVTLVRNGFLLEAHILARNCVENAFWLGALQADPDGFPAEMAQDEARSQRSQIASVRDGRTLLDAADQERLEKLAAALEARWPKARPLQAKRTAEKSALSPLYLMYRYLSIYAAHPTLKALGRYVTRNAASGLVDIHMKPVARPGDAERAIHAACLGLMSACVAFNQFAGPVQAGTWLNGLADDFGQLTAVTPGLREPPT